VELFHTANAVPADGAHADRMHVGLRPSLSLVFRGHTGAFHPLGARKLSFFDDEDEPETASQPPPRRRPPGGGGRRAGAGRPAGGGRSAGGGRPPGRGRPPGGGRASGGAVDRQTIQQRRLALAVGAVIFVILAAVGINSCESSALTSSLTNYASGVSSIIQQSNNSSGTLFGTDLGSPRGTNSAQALLGAIEKGPLHTANSLLQQAQNLSVPDQMSNAQHNVLLTLKLRRDGILTIASQIEQALGNSTNQDALQAIAAAMAGFLGSDVVYKEYAAKEIAEQLHADSIGVGGTSGVSLPAGQFLPNLAWLEISYLASKLGARYTPTGSSSANSNLPVQPGLHGHVLNSVSVNNTTLNPNASNAVPASPPPTFSLNITNGGHFPENNVTCKVTVLGTSIGGSIVIPQTTPGETTSCSVALSKSPSPGQYQVTAEVAPVPGEGNKTNNSLTYPITFQ
jgi:hypothetical protein